MHQTLRTAEFLGKMLFHSSFQAKGYLMKKMLAFIMASLLLATIASANLDPDPNTIGIYFDTAGDINCTTVGTSVPFDAYVIISNPTSQEMFAFEFSYRMETVPAGQGVSVFRLNNIIPDGIDLGDNADLLMGEYIFGYGDPVPAAGANVICVSWTFFVTVPMGLDFYLGPTAIESGVPDGLPAYLGDDNVYFPLGVSTGHPDLGNPVAQVNGDCPVATENTSFGGVKALFR